jgi:ribose transport system permease protein
LAAIAGAVIGGASLFGGRASIPGAVLGALLAVLLQNGLVIVGLPVFYQQVAIGGVLIVAVLIDQRNTRRAS